jgi:hypothetical protein
MRHAQFIMVLLCLFLSACSYGQAYQQKHDKLNLRLSLLCEIKPGNSIGQVELILGQGSKATPLQASLIQRAMRRTEAKTVYRFADGIRDIDTFVLYGYGKCSVIWLQFRDGQLINHVPDEYAKADVLDFVTHR